MKLSPLQQFHKAFKQRDLSLAQHLIEDDPDAINIHGGKEYFFSLACKQGWVESAQWLLTLEKSHGPVDIHVRDEGAFRWACRRQDFTMIRWLLSLEPTHGRINIHPVRKFHTGDFRGDVSAFVHACKSGHLDIAQFLVSLESTHGQIDIHYGRERVFRWACAYGRREVAEWLLTLQVSHRPFHWPDVFRDDLVLDKDWHCIANPDHETVAMRYDDSSLYMACRNGQMEMVQWLLDLAMQHDCGDIDIDFNHAFRLTCSHGHQSLAEWLLQNKETSASINLHSDREGAFRKACGNGHLQVARWLESLKSSHGRIDIHIGNEKIFRTACTNGQLAVAQWLCSLEPEYGAIWLDPDYEGPFRQACNHNQLETAQWLADLHIRRSIPIQPGIFSLVLREALMDSSYPLAAWLLCYFDYWLTHFQLDEMFFLSMGESVACRLRKLLPFLLKRLKTYDDRKAVYILRWLLGHQSLHRDDRQRVIDELVWRTQHQLVSSHENDDKSE